MPPWRHPRTVAGELIRITVTSSRVGNSSWWLARTRTLFELWCMSVLLSFLFGGERQQTESRIGRAGTAELLVWRACDIQAWIAERRRGRSRLGFAKRTVGASMGRVARVYGVVHLDVLLDEAGHRRHHIADDGIVDG